MILMKDIIREGHPTLRKKAEEVKFPLSDEDRQLCDDMMEYIVNSQDDELCEKYGLRSGIGLAAPQVNASKRIFVLHIPDEEYALENFIAINPKIVSHSVEKTYISTGEGCLSVDREVPGYVPRYARITVKAFDKEGNVIKKRLKGLPAIAFQHELDHLNGIMFYDHIDENAPYKEIPDAVPFDRE
ncbi:peptide deformylase [Sporosarcina sp. P37]|uniref:peptide deformylase n=1 Tax=unclassified Sporosarcina TaxID=2647733 RepID=UPI0009C0F614|nr:MULTISPECIES: peptide deformylase [unclassified Sporosarcina]ARD49759.1 peptide deformylase [Sporosarcina sp. P33]ARK26336.1 peptide deformylase [Sporosarcina sp. P37]PID18064.1 peptide deformylase [Sporosarcina sp. P35]